MRWTHSIPAVAAVLSGITEASPSWPSSWPSAYSTTSATPITTTQYTTQYTESCKSYVNTYPGMPCPTTTIVTTIDECPTSVKITTTPTITFIPPTFTSTISITAWTTRTLTLPPYNITMNVTSTVTSNSYLISDITTTSTVTQTSTKTLTTSTSTHFAQYGWRPIGLTHNETFPGGNKSFSFAPPHRTLATAVPLAKPIRIKNVQLYATSVVCTESVVIGTGVTTIYPASTTASTTLPAKTTSSTKYLTLTTTTTVQPKYNNTIINSFTTTSVTTTTIFSSITTYTTTTATATIATGVVDFYGPCGPSRILGPKLGNRFPPAQQGNIVDDFTVSQNSLNLVTSFEADVYDCCVSCLTGKDCAFGGYDTVQRICYLAEKKSEVCGTQESTSESYLSEPNGLNGDPVQVFNGFCGYLYNGGYGL